MFTLLTKDDNPDCGDSSRIGTLNVKPVGDTPMDFEEAKLAIATGNYYVGFFTFLRTVSPEQLEELAKLVAKDDSTGKFAFTAERFARRR